MNTLEKFSTESNIPLTSINKTIELLNEGATIPFIARYRKEYTNYLNEIQIRDIYDFKLKNDKLNERKEELINYFTTNEEISEEFKKDLISKVQTAESIQELDTIYEPFKKKKANKALIARQQGLDKALDFLLSYACKNLDMLNQYINQEKNLNTIDEVLSGLQDLLSEKISLDTEFRNWFKTLIFKFSSFSTKKSKKAEDTQEIYTAYYDNNWKINSLPEWRVLAINRAEKDKIINVNLDIPKDKILEIVFKNNFTESKSNDNFLTACASKATYLQGINKNLPCFDFVIECYKNYINKSLVPSIEREIRNDLTTSAHEQSIKVFQKNLSALLLTPPLEKKIILAIDPGFRTGCKCAIIDKNGNLLDYMTIFPIKLNNSFDNNKIIEAKDIINKALTKHNFELIAIGNGTASKETEHFINDWIKENKLNIQYTIVSEAGASVYSASKTAIDEFPNLDLTVRGAISIGRRLQNMLDELVKIPPESIGVGMYQHDIPIKDLSNKLALEVESAVNTIGVDLNRASIYLLQYISGLNLKLVKEIAKYRKTNKLFHNRLELLKVKGIGDKIFELCAGFCKIYESDNPLDKTTIHPEKYSLVYSILNDYKLIDNLNNYFNNTQNISIAKDIELTLLNNQKDIHTKFAVSAIELKDIINNLLYSSAEYIYQEKNKPILKHNSTNIQENDLYVGQKISGIVRNVTDFGIFIDIGLKNDALMYRSVCKNNELQKYSPGDTIETIIINMNKQPNETYKIGLGPIN